MPNACKSNGSFPNEGCARARQCEQSECAMYGQVEMFSALQKLIRSVWKLTQIHAHAYRALSSRITISLHFMSGVRTNGMAYGGLDMMCTSAIGGSYDDRIMPFEWCLIWYTRPNRTRYIRLTASRAIADSHIDRIRYTSTSSRSREREF